MNISEAIEILQAKLAHVTRDYRPEDRAFDVLRKAALSSDPGWLPIDQADRSVPEIWAFNGEQGRMRWIEGKDYALWIWADELLAEVDPAPEQPTHFRPLPAPPNQEESECHD